MIAELEATFGVLQILRIGVSPQRGVLGLALLVTAATGAVHGQNPPVQPFNIHVDGPAYTNLPIWVKADLRVPLEVHYPYHEDPGDFGPNRIEVKREGRILSPLPIKPSWRDTTE